MIFPILAICAHQLGRSPDIPPGLNEAFVSTCYAVERDLSEGNFSEAQATATLLPKDEATIGLDIKGVSELRQGDFRDQLTRVISEAKPMIRLVLAKGNTPDILVSFVPGISRLAGEAELPPAAHIEFHRSEPRLSLQISLTRTTPPKNSTANDVHNEIAFAVAQYIGLERVPRFGTYASRTDQSTAQRVTLEKAEAILGQRALEISHELREMAKSQTRISLSAPSITTNETSIQGVKGLQDEALQVGLKVTNNGTANLALYALPDCSCLRPYVQPTIKPGETADLVADVNTALYTGHLTHSVLIFSNDPNRPVLSIPVHMDIEPFYRFVRSSEEAVPLTGRGADFDVYLALAEPVKFSIITASIVGMPGTVRYEPFHGVIPDDSDSLGEVSNGFRFQIHMDPGKFNGRYPANLLLGTDNDTFRELTYGFQVQKGIVAMPGQFNFGNVPNEPMTFSLVVSNANKGFRVTSISSASPDLTARAVAIKGDHEYRIDVSFDGKAGIGNFASALTIHTDDVTQPLIKVPIMGQVQ